MKSNGFGAGVGSHKEHSHAKKNKHKNFSKGLALEMGISTERRGDFLRDPAEPAKAAFGVKDPKNLRLYNAILLLKKRIFLGKR